MGYYSDIAIVLSPAAAAALRHNVLQATEDKQIIEEFIAHTDLHTLDPETGAELFLWLSRKWYSAFPEVEFWQGFLETLPLEDYHFLRLGEDAGDIEESGALYAFGLYVRQKIASDKLGFLQP